MMWLTLLVAAVAQAGAAKLIVMPPDQPAIIIEYSTMARCERARAALLRQVQQETISKDDAADLARRLGRPVIIESGPRAYCIPS